MYNKTVCYEKQIVFHRCTVNMDRINGRVRPCVTTREEMLAIHHKSSPLLFTSEKNDKSRDVLLYFTDVRVRHFRTPHEPALMSFILR